MRGSPHQEKENDPQLQFLCKSLALGLSGPKIVRHTHTAVRTATEAEEHIQQT